MKTTLSVTISIAIDVNLLSFGQKYEIKIDISIFTREII